MASSDETKDILKKMAQFSISNNQISEIHEKNLKMYPFVFFNGVNSVTIEYDFTNQNTVGYDTNPKTFEIVYKFKKPNTDNFKVIYNLQIDETQDNTDLNKRFEALENSIVTLLWKGIPLEVNFNGKNVYKSKTNE